MPSPEIGTLSDLKEVDEVIFNRNSHSSEALQNCNNQST